MFPMALPKVVRTVLDYYRDRLEVEVPGLVQGFYFVGSVALADFQPNTSDIDFVAVTSRSPTSTDIRALGRVHADVAKRFPRPPFTGPYVTWAELASDPQRSRPGARVKGSGVLDLSSCEDRQPVVWHTLAEHGVTGFGPDAEEIEVHTDRAGLTAWTRANLNGYWRCWHRTSGRYWSLHGLAMLGSRGPVWAVLGSSRLHYTLATGKIASKREAGEYALATFGPRWERILLECLRIRTQEPGRSRYRSRLARRRDALDFLAMVIDDAVSVGRSDSPENGRQDHLL